MSSDAHSPRPTFQKGVTLDRRTYLKLAGATGAATIGAGTVAAEDDDDEENEVEFNPTEFTITDWIYTKNFLDYVANGDYNSDPTADEINLHNHSVTARHWWNEMFGTVMDNRLEYGQMPANVEARARIADDWEDGMSTSEARDGALEAISDFFDTPYINSTQAIRTSVFQLSANATVAREDPDISDTFVSWHIKDDNYSGDASLEQSGTYIDEPENETQVEITLPSGEVHETTMPKFHHEWDNGDSLTISLDDDLLSYYDSDQEMFVGVPTEQGETADFKGVIMVENVPDTDLTAETVGVLSEWADVLDEIDSRDSETRANYDTTLVDILYDALDEGEITPADVRGVLDLAEHYSGTSDVTSHRFQMALLLILGLDRPDLSKISGVDFSYEAWTDRQIDRNDSGVIELAKPTDFTEDTVEGMLYGDLVKETTLSRNSTFLANPVMVSVFSGETNVQNELFLVDARDGSEIHRIYQSSYSGGSYSPSPSAYDAVISPTGRYAATAERDGTEDLADARVFDAWTGEQLYSHNYSDNDRIWNVAFSPDEEYYAFRSEDGFELRSMEDGDLVWASPLDLPNANVIEFNPAGDLILYGSREGDAIVLDYDGNVVLDLDLSESENVVDVEFIDENDSIMASVDGVTYGYDIDGNLLWEVTDDVGRASVSPNGEFVIYESLEQVFYFDLETEETTYLFDHDSDIRALRCPTNNHIVLKSNNNLAMYTVEGDLVWKESYDDNCRSIGFSHYNKQFGDVDGFLNYPLGFDSPSGTEHPIISGAIEIDALRDRDGEVVDDDEEYEWERPKDDTADGDEYVKYVKTVTEEHKNVIEEEEGDETEVEVGFSWPGWFDDYGAGSAFAGIAIIGALVLLVVSFVTDLLPWTS